MEILWGQMLSQDGKASVHFECEGRSEFLRTLLAVIPVDDSKKAAVKSKKPDLVKFCFPRVIPVNRTELQIVACCG